MLRFPDFEKEFEVQTNASDFSIGGVLMQERAPSGIRESKALGLRTKILGS